MTRVFAVLLFPVLLGAASMLPAASPVTFSETVAPIL